MGEYSHFLAKLDEYEKGIGEEFPLSPTIPTQEHLKVISKMLEHEITKCMHKMHLNLLINV